MEMLFQLGEAVVIAFLMGAVMGAVVAVHLSACSARRRQQADERVRTAARPAEARVRRSPAESQGGGWQRGQK